MDFVQRPDHEGYLHKRGQVRWNRRYFALVHTALRYWENESQAKANNFSAGGKTVHVVGCEVEDARGGNGFHFVVRGLPLNLQLYAASEDDRDLWLARLKSAMIADVPVAALATAEVPAEDLQRSRYTIGADGLCIVINDDLVVLEASGEAFELGIRVGDRLVSLNNVVLTGRTREAVVDMLMTVDRPYTVVVHKQWVRRDNLSNYTDLNAHEAEMIRVAFHQEERSMGLWAELRGRIQEVADERASMTEHYQRQLRGLGEARRKIDEERRELAKEKAEMAALAADTDIVRLNIGGTVFPVVSRATLTLHEHSKLAWLFSGRHDSLLADDGQGRLFLDYPPKAFSCLLDRLRVQRMATRGIAGGNKPKEGKSHEHNGVRDGSEGVLGAKGVMSDTGTVTNESGQYQSKSDAAEPGIGAASAAIVAVGTVDSKSPPTDASIPEGVERACWETMLDALGLKDAIMGLGGVEYGEHPDGDSGAPLLGLRLACTLRSWDLVSSGSHGFMFDVRAVASHPLVITALNLCGCTASNCVVYAAEGSHVDIHDNPARWAEVARGRIRGKASTYVELAAAMLLRPMQIYTLYVASDSTAGVAFVAGGGDDVDDDGAGTGSDADEGSAGGEGLATTVVAKNTQLEIFSGHYSSSAEPFAHYTASGSWCPQVVISYRGATAEELRLAAA